MILPAFQAQNPAISGYSLGWLSCTAYSAAMAGSYDQQRAILCTGQQVRQLTHDTTGGLNLQQVDAALLEGWDVNLNTVYGGSWADFVDRIDQGRGAILQGRYSPIADSRFDAGRGFRGNHAVFVAPGWIVMDPLADGRAPGVYRYHGEPYPQQLLRRFAGQLDIGGRSLGDGKVYASYTQDRAKVWSVTIRPLKGDERRSYTRYHVEAVGGDRQITASRRYETRGFQAACTSPRMVLTASGDARVPLVKVTDGGYAGIWVSAKWAGVR